MTKPAWTPGPWMLRKARPPFDPDWGVLAPECVNVLAEAFCEFRKKGQFDHDEAEANARLIAAAPELFEALNAIVCAGHEWARQEVDHDNTPADEALLNALRDARAALRKATGEQQ